MPCTCCARWRARCTAADCCRAMACCRPCAALRAVAGAGGAAAPDVGCQGWEDSRQYLWCGRRSVRVRVGMRFISFGYGHRRIASSHLKRKSQDGTRKVIVHRHVRAWRILRQIPQNLPRQPSNCTKQHPSWLLHAGACRNVCRMGHEPYMTHTTSSNPLRSTLVTTTCTRPAPLSITQGPHQKHDGHHMGPHLRSAHTRRGPTSCWLRDMVSACQEPRPLREKAGWLLAWGAEPAARIVAACRFAACVLTHGRAVLGMCPC